MFSLWISASWRTKELVSKVSRSGQRIRWAGRKLSCSMHEKCSHGWRWLTLRQQRPEQGRRYGRSTKREWGIGGEKQREVRTLSVSSHSRVPIHVSAGNKLAQRRDFPEKDCIPCFNPIKYANAHLIQILIYFQIPVKSDRQVVASRVVFNLTTWELETYTSPHSASNDIIRPADDRNLCCCQINLTTAPPVLKEVVYNARGNSLMKMLSTTDCDRIFPLWSNFIPPGQPVTLADIPSIVRHKVD